ncbi:MAG: DUF2853 family protein [Saprospiraceae bacterium]|nr:DUF2853 family protein [Saprospiraceae bacterium]
MSKFDEAVEKYSADLKEIGVSVDAGLLTAVTKGLGPSIYNQDSSMVACSDAEELARVKNNFLIGKLGLADSPALDEALQAVCSQYDKRFKQRAVFYYLLVVKFKKQSVYA